MNSGEIEWVYDNDVESEEVREMKVLLLLLA